eukprot:GEMP01061626.1.p1 GENE.GEMP01061626.1~~GEMP01061626.1.p1  ORF type:complete len:153 (+),score=27.65 GEMP01061626.1:205-663(+)
MPRGDSRSPSRDRRRSRSPVKSKSILIKNLNYDTTNDNLRDALEQFGSIKDIYIPLNYHNQRPKGFAFVEFHDGKDADNTVGELDQTRLLGNTIQVCIAKDRRKSPGTMRKMERDGGRRDRSRSRSRSYRRKDSRSRHRRRDSRSVSRRRRY